MRREQHEQEARKNERRIERERKMESERSGRGWEKSSVRESTKYRSENINSYLKNSLNRFVESKSSTSVPYWQWL